MDTGDGKWNWQAVKKPRFLDIVIQRLKAFECMSWQEIIGTGSHLIEIDKIIPEARKRLEDLNQEDVDVLMSLRLSGKKRIWGIRDGSVLKVLWWDPNHEICPSVKKRT